MDTSRISFGEMIAGASGVALFIFMLLPWYGVSADVKGIGSLGSVNVNAWESFSFIDLLLFLAAAVAVGMAVARAMGAMPSGLPAPPGMIVAGAGGLAVLLILFRILNTPGEDLSGIGVNVGRKIGIFLGLIAAGGITFGGWTAMNERASGEAPPADPPPADPVAPPPAV